MKYIKLSDLIHVMLGIIAIKLDLIMPISLLFGLYEVMDSWIQVQSKKLIEPDRFILSNWILEEKRELRKDMGAFILGLLVGALF